MSVSASKFFILYAKPIRSLLIQRIPAGSPFRLLALTVYRNQSTTVKYKASGSFTPFKGYTAYFWLLLWDRRRISQYRLKLRNSLAGCDAQDNNGGFFFSIVAKTRLERAVEIKTNRSTQNENNLKKLKLCRILGLVELLLEKHVWLQSHFLFVMTGTLGQTRRMRKRKPRVLKVSWHFGISY